MLLIRHIQAARIQQTSQKITLCKNEDLEKIIINKVITLLKRT